MIRRLGWLCGRILARWHWFAVPGGNGDIFVLYAGGFCRGASPGSDSGYFGEDIAGEEGLSEDHDCAWLYGVQDCPRSVGKKGVDSSKSLLALSGVCGGAVLWVSRHCRSIRLGVSRDGRGRDGYVSKVPALG